MGYSDMIIFIMEIVGTVAFAASGAMTGIQKRMDLFGVNVLGVTTAVGGGLIRDLILGLNPPVMFQNPRYALTAVITSTVLFIFMYVRAGVHTGRHAKMREILLFVGDTIGLGIFTVVGSHTAVTAGYGDNRFLLVFVGVMTGVGGGMLRDVLAGNMPYILVKHVYAVASLSGALVYVLLLPYLSGLSCMMAGAVAVMLIRILAAYYRWNLPRIP
ncbi:MAG: TRIC cation channel family protein [Lachnospiraceae bacterium]|nr:TRIC cation channel family protein [Lachnospiraceae bacterium]